MEESELIDQFLKNELTAKETEAVNIRIQNEAEFQKKIALRKLVMTGISEAYVEELKIKLKKFDRSLEKKSRFQFSWKIAAVFSGIILISSVLLWLNRKPNPYNFDLVEAGLPNTMGKAENVVFLNAMNEFKAGDYASSGKIFSDLLLSQPKNDTLLYFSGLCDFRTEQIRLATVKLNSIIPQSEFYNKARYRLALCYWIEGNIEEATKILDDIKDGDIKMEVEKVLQALR
ncbi:MAG: hypothetical protein JST69_07145 [Bacteroidetes bacterium]|nr:hypothetical protein [Bacteroidota bacterium]